MNQTINKPLDYILMNDIPRQLETWRAEDLEYPEDERLVDWTTEPLAYGARMSALAIPSGLLGSSAVYYNSTGDIKGTLALLGLGVLSGIGTYFVSKTDALDQPETL